MDLLIDLTLWTLKKILIREIADIWPLRYPRNCNIYKIYKGSYGVSNPQENQVVKMVIAPCPDGRGLYPIINDVGKYISQVEKKV